MIGPTIRIAALLLILVGGSLLAACGSDMGSCLGPIQTTRSAARIASLAGPPPRDPEPAGAACPIQVEFDGRPYEDTRVSNSLYDAWGFSAADLMPLGHATRATGGSTYVDDSVFAIRGVDPLFAIAMHDRSPTGFFVLVKDGNHWPDALCGFLVKRPLDPSVCAKVSPSPDDSGRTGSRSDP